MFFLEAADFPNCAIHISVHFFLSCNICLKKNPCNKVEIKIKFKTDDEYQLLEEMAESDIRYVKSRYGFYVVELRCKSKCLRYDVFSLRN